jgi:hypothetical protein
MKIIILSVCTVGFLVLNSCHQNKEWQDLFNGNDLDGWEIKGAEESNFFVEDGIIVMETKMEIPNSFLVTTRDYTDFELEVEFLVDRGMNTGVQIRSNVYLRDTTTAYLSGRLEDEIRDWPAGTVHGYQIEIDPSDRAWTGGFYEEGGRGWLVPLTENEEARVAFRQDEWNHFRIIADGNRFQTWINGVQAIDTTDDLTASGFIGLQLHSIWNEEQEGRRTLWKNIRIRELDH